MSGARSRRKGANFERAVARMLRNLGVEAKRGLQSRGGGAEQADVMSALPYHFECKAGKRPNVWAAYEQACNDAQEGRTPCVIMHRDQARPGEGATELLVLPLDVGLRVLVEHHQMAPMLRALKRASVVAAGVLTGATVPTKDDAEAQAVREGCDD